MLTPAWNQRVFEERFEGLHPAAAPVFIVECARMGLILRFPYWKNPRTPRPAAPSRVSAGPSIAFSRVTLQVAA